MFIALLTVILNSHQALEEKEKHEAAVERYHTRMDESDLSATEREKLEKAKAQHVECDERCQGVKEELASIEEEVKDVCARKHRTSIIPSRQH